MTLGDRKDTPPLIGDLADNAGPTRTVALLAGSPALGGAGGPCVQINGATPLDHDQRGLVRANPCDIGAFQHQNPQITLDPTLDGLPQVGQTADLPARGRRRRPAVHAFDPVAARRQPDRRPDDRVLRAGGGRHRPRAVVHRHGLQHLRLGQRDEPRRDRRPATASAERPRRRGSGGSGSTTTTTPKLTKLRLSPSSIRRGRKGRVTFTLSAAAKVTFKLQRKTRGTKVGKSCVKRTRSHRHRASCTRLVKAGGAPQRDLGEDGLRQLVVDAVEVADSGQLRADRDPGARPRRHEDVHDPPVAAAHAQPTYARHERLAAISVNPRGTRGTTFCGSWGSRT